MLSVNFFEVNLQNIDTRCYEKKERGERTLALRSVIFEEAQKKCGGCREPELICEVLLTSSWTHSRPDLGNF